ncbi:MULTISPECIES: DUF2771 domain-containing protein [unclassified Streptomyces]|uniref:DUF2771 domain-containing protein n=1 Tax=unclassified Streptomyces TaxID=2593676 RepID=UPI0022B68D03|nr:MULTISPECIES: DUF2771 domain-containing protein [unclassified Streptomyces]MCZ7414890.1 DUF2771 domain-containing protein [Streptomyces sp. WMMC897]MCZ7431833.1 DUF2771 domain-containing protein [Streptomyces sp. WMMC1477]
MTSMPSRLRGRHTRAAVAAGTAVVALFTLSACGEKPTPMTTVTVGSNSVFAEAACYNDGDKLSDKTLEKCGDEADKVDKDQTITLDRDENLSVGVEPEVAERGWFVLLDGRPLGEFRNYHDTTYQSFEVSDIFDGVQQLGMEQRDSVTLTILETPEPKADQKEQPGVFGVWNFKLNLD